MSADVHVLTIKPDLGGEPVPEHEDGEDDGEGADYEASLEDAFHAVEEKDLEGFKASMGAAIKACFAKLESEPHEEED